MVSSTQFAETTSLNVKIDDDTPERGYLPKVYPRNPPVNLLRGPRELKPCNLFAFEGLDGSGKSTLANLAVQNCVPPGKTGAVLRLGQSDIVTHAAERAKWLNANPLTLNLLNWIAILENTISSRESLGSSETVLFADRYLLTIKVRGQLEGLDTGFTDLLEAFVPRPRRIFFVDVPPELCLERIQRAGRKISYFEAGCRYVSAVGETMVEQSISARSSTDSREDALLRYLERSRDFYIQLATEAENVTIIANNGDPNEALSIISSEVSRKLTSS